MVGEFWKVAEFWWLNFGILECEELQNPIFMKIATLEIFPLYGIFQLKLDYLHDKFTMLTILTTHE